jgi:hypothetical protein
VLNVPLNAMQRLGCARLPLGRPDALQTPLVAIGLEPLRIRLNFVLQVPPSILLIFEQHRNSTGAIMAGVAV